MIYTRDLAPGYTAAQMQAEHAHVRAHLSAVASTDDDPETNADAVHVRHETLPDGGLRIVGELDADPDATYLKPDFDAFAGISPDLLAAAGLEAPDGA